MNNILTVDVEDWYHGNYRSLPADLVKSPERVRRNTNDLLDILDEHSARATFFLLGEVAEAHPELVRAIESRGHEIAAHGFRHDLVYEIGPETFRADIRRCKKLLEDITGRPVLGYRAPSWSLTTRAGWAHEILAAEGFSYSSSVFPVANYLYGIAGAPLEIYRPDPDQAFQEIPVSCARLFGKPVPFSGGFYMRLLPSPVLKFLERSVNRAGRPVIYYLHPREIDPDQPRLPLGNRMESFIHHYGLRASRGKFLDVLQRNSFVSFREYYEMVEPAETRALRR